MTSQSERHSAPLLSVRALHKAYDDRPILRGVDFSVAPGEVAFLIGPSGGGKSTLLRCTNFLETPSSGEIQFENRRLCDEDSGVFRLAPASEIRSARVEMPMVFQHFNLFSHRTVLENVIEGPLIVQRRARSEVEEEARQLLSQVGLPDKAAAYPAELSGGQKQRVAIARALALKPKLILFDEPTSALDPELVAGVLDIIRGLAEGGMTMLIVSHEMGFARKLADKVHFVCNGIIEESGTPDEIFERPRSERLQTFIKSVLN